MLLNSSTSVLIKNPLLRVFLYMLGGLISSQAWAYDVETLQEKAIEQQLWTQPLWTALLHYNQGGTWRDRSESYIDFSPFFFSNQGHHDPKQEMLAAIKVLFADDAKPCSTLSRYHFLFEHLVSTRDEQWQQATKSCNEFNQLLARLKPQRLDLIFPSSYLNAPSSMFGHTLFRIVSEEGIQGNNDLFSLAISFGANVPNSVHPLEYMSNGLLGGFPGFYIYMPYFAKIQEYNHEESRDLWEYHLNFTPEEITRLLEHLWELNQVQFDYYYLDENCSYRLLELLAVLRPDVDWATDLRFAEIPINTIRKAKEQGLVTKVQYRPSVLSQIRQQLSPLSVNDLAHVKALQSDLVPLEGLNPDQQAQLLSTAYAVYRFNHRRDWSESDISHHGLDLLKARAKLSNTTSNSRLHIQTPRKPDEAHGVKRTAVGWSRHDNQHTLDLQWRYAYHDLLDNNVGVAKGFGLEVFNINLALNEDKVWLKQFELLNVQSISPRNTLIKPISWEMSAGYLDTNKDRDARHFYAQGGIGVSYNIQNLQWYVIPKAQLRQPLEESLHYGLGIKTGLVYQGKKFSTSAEVEHIYWKERTLFEHNVFRLEAQYHLNKNNSLRLAWQSPIDVLPQSKNTLSLHWQHHY
ncbi:MAG: hypothetical protein ACI85N_002387 [Gammaproteobacteria bacterium]|jgi:hypothetical protein